MQTTRPPRPKTDFDRTMDRGFAWLIARRPLELLSILGVILAFPWVLFATTPVSSDDLVPILEILLTLVPFVVVLVLVLPRFPRGRQRNLLLGFFASLISYGLADFAYMYWTLSQVTPSSFSERLTRLDAAYLAIGNFTTAGSGINALSPHARALVTAQLALGFATVAIGIAVALAPRQSGLEDEPH